MGRIRVLPKEIVSMIAAGEVVERPASVVKELVENSIDAGARKIEVCLLDGGLRYIGVTDDGEGMDRDDALLAFERHATSKFKDLSRIDTMGFRGEALASIASVAEVVLTTRRRDKEVGTRVKVKGESCEIKEVGTLPGTTVEVTKLFFSLPGRRKFLKSPSTELRHVVDVVYRFVFSHPDIVFKVRNNKRLLLNLPGREDLERRVEDIFGREVSEELIPFRSEMEGASVAGLLSLDDLKESGSSIFIYVNNRWIRDRLVAKALLDGLHTVIPKGRYPLAIVQLYLPHGSVDVNVHPTKTEVRFSDSGLIYRLIKIAVEKATKTRRIVPLKEVHPRLLAIREPTTPYRTPRSRGLPFAAREEEMDGGVRILGQLWGEYLLCEDRNNLYIIDQHAAHERIAFERLKAEYKEKGLLRPEPLLLPEVITLTPKEKVALEEAQTLLKDFGLEIEAFGGEDFAIKTVPWLLKDRDYTEWIKTILSEPQILREGLSERFIDNLLMTIACHSVIRGKKTLFEDEVRALLEDLEEVSTYRCPHGRPIVKIFSRSEVDRFFRKG